MGEIGLKNRYRILLVVIFFFVVVSCVISWFLLNRQAPKSITLEQICNDKVISIWGLDETSTTTDFSKNFGQSYEQYAEKLVSAYESGNFQSIMFSFEGKNATLSVVFKDDILRSATINIVDVGVDENDWKEYSDTIIRKLKTLSVSEEHSSHFFFDNAEILLEFSPVNREDYEIHADGTTTWAGEIGEYGSKITEIIIRFIQ